MKVGELKIWQLSETMRQHLAWYLDNHTVIGYVTACHIAKGSGEWRDKTIEDILRFGGVSTRMIRFHANSIMKYDKHNPKSN